MFYFCFVVVIIIVIYTCPSYIYISTSSWYTLFFSFFSFISISSDLRSLPISPPPCFSDNPELGDILAPCFEECRDEGVETQNHALEWIGKKIRAAKIANEGGRRWTRMGTDPILEAREVISTVVLPHIPAPSFCLREKKFFVALMARKVMMAKLDPDNNLDDKDYYGNKQLNLAGFMIGLLFEGLFVLFV